MEEDNSFDVKRAEAFMSLLLGAGFDIQSVLEHGLEYMMSLAPYSGLDRSNCLLFAAEVVNRTAKKLHIDPESRYQVWRGSSETAF